MTPPPGHSWARRQMRPAGMVLAAAAGFAGFALAAITGMAIAKSFTLKAEKHAKVTNLAAHTTKQETIATTSHGVAVYTLSGESSHHLLCTSKACFSFWPPVKVPSAHAKVSKAPGIKGKLGVLHRKGFFQLTLNGHPLYNFSIDGGKKGVAMGEGVMSFGGTWHVVKLPGGSPAAKGTTPTPTTPTTPYYPATPTTPY